MGHVGLRTPQKLTALEVDLGRAAPRDHRRAILTRRHEHVPAPRARVVSRMERVTALGAGPPRRAPAVAVGGLAATRAQTVAGVGREVQAVVAVLLNVEEDDVLGVVPVAEVERVLADAGVDEELGEADAAGRERTGHGTGSWR